MGNHLAAHFAENTISPLLEFLCDFTPFFRAFEKDRLMFKYVFAEAGVFVPFTPIIIASRDWTLNLSYNDVVLLDLCICC